MSTVTVPALTREPQPPRMLPRFNLALALDVTVLRSGIPDRIPGRSVDINDRGLGVVLAGELFVGESVAVEFWLPRLEEPLKARALVRHHSQLRCGLEFQGLSPQQQGLIHSWTQHKTESVSRSSGWVRTHEKPASRQRSSTKSKRKQIVQTLWRYRFRITALFIVAASLGWWRWQRGWTEIEAELPTKEVLAQPQVMVPSAEMEQRITHKVDPVYPEDARKVHLHGTVVLHAIIAPDGTVVRLEFVSGPQPLAQAAMDAARWWRYQPYLVNGTPVEVETNVEVPFSDYAVTAR